jgi:hypothetical protein
VRTVVVPSLLLLVAAGTLLPLRPARAQAGRAQAGVFDPRTGRFAYAFPAEAERAADTVAAPVPRVWEARHSIYVTLGIPVTLVDSASHVIGAVRATQRRLVANRRLSALLECGMGSYGPNADRYTVQLSALSAVRELPDGRSVVDSRVGGVAAPNGVNSSVNCGSTGVLEDVIAEELRKVAKP